MSADVDFDLLESVLDSEFARHSSTTASDDQAAKRDDLRRSEGRSDGNDDDRQKVKRRGAGSDSRVRDEPRHHNDRRYSQRSRSRSVGGHSRRRHHRSRSYGRRSPSPRRRRGAEDADARMAAMKAREEQRRKSEQERLQKEENDKMKKELDEARRDDLTVLVLNLSLKATERDVWKFFSEKCGKVRDIQVIRDSRSGKSKGVGYVEFYTPTSVMTSLAMSGQLILDQPIAIQASQAEKNRAAKAAKQQQAELTEHGPMKIYVGGLVENLAALSEADLRQLFSPFGDIVNVDLHKDPYTGRSKGYAFIHFRNAQDAREAMTAMNGFDIGGKSIKVGYATENIQRPPIVTGNPYQTALQFAEAANDNERLDDEGGGLLSGVNPRISLMQKLQRTEGVTTVNQQTSAGIQQQLQNLMLPGLMVPATPSVSPISPNVCLEPLFSAEDVAKEGPLLLDDIEEDVRTECAKFGTVLKVFINRRLLDKKVYVKFAASEMAVKAQQGMTGRFFAGHPIQCSFIPDQIWNAVCQ